MSPIKSYWFDRFQVFKNAESYVFRDFLFPDARIISQSAFAELSGGDLDIAFFRQGFLRPCLEPFPLPVAERRRSPDDVLFWQFPCLTEAVAYGNHAGLMPRESLERILHCYIGLPWATFIDTGEFPQETLKLLRIRLSGWRSVLRMLGCDLCVHTVCQHIHWSNCVSAWAELGITDAWLSHATVAAQSQGLPFAVHPWALYAVNVEDPERQNGLAIDKDPADKKYLASFIGAHMGHYLSDVRLRLRELASEPKFMIQVTDKWHFDDVVYKHQVRHAPLEENYQIGRSVAEYNEILCDSIFALCPSGAGPNTLRLWEALAVGAIPVLLGEMPLLPAGGSLPEIEWDGIVLKICDEQLTDLPRLLCQIPLEELRIRQQRALSAYALIRNQKCF